MPQELSTHDAIAMVIDNQKSLIGFYSSAAELAENGTARQVFTRLADETRNRLAHYCHFHYGKGRFEFDSFMATPMPGGTVMLHELQEQLNPVMNDYQARELAMREELDIEKRLKLYADRVLNPVAREILRQAADEMGRHAAIIESEFAHTMRMVHETDINTFVRE